MAAFKESGAIEYGSDILIGLQLTGTGSDGFDADKAKEKNPKEIDFCILKNRNGNIKSDGIPLIFHSEFNCFTENNGTFIPITKEIEDMLPFDD